MTSDNRIPLAGLWGTIQAAVRERLSTADLWQRANEAAQSRGFAGVSGSAIEMGTLRSIAARVRNAAEAFAAADPITQLTSEHMAPDLNARSMLGMNTTPNYRVRFLQQVRTATGDMVETFRTISFPVQLPATKAELLLELEANAEVMAETYGESHVAVPYIEITVI